MKKEAQVYITQKITILIFCSFVPLLVLGNNTKVHNFNIQHLTIESGLPHTDANATIQDKNGIIWIGTYSGLCKYDGHLIETFHQTQEGLNNTYTNRILDISIDDKGLLWLATAGGIQLFDPNKKEYISLKIKDSKSINNLEKILTVKNKYVYIKNSDNSLFLYERNDSKNELIPILINLESKCYSIRKDSLDRVWVSSDQGCFIINEKDINLLELPNSILKEEGKEVRYTFLDSKNQLLIATHNNLYKSDSVHFIKSENKEGSLYKLKSLKKTPISFKKGLITDIVEDYNNNYWISSTKGLFFMNKESVITTFYAGESTKTLNSDYIISLFIDKTDNLFISTYAGGVNIIDLRQKPFHRIQYQPNNPFSLSEKIIRAIADDEQHLWVGTHSTGLNRINKTTHEVLKVQTDKTNTSIGSNNIRSLLLQNNQLWVGHTSGLDIIYLNTSPLVITRLNEVSNFPSDEVTSLSQDCYGQVWAGTWKNGVIRIDQNHNDFTCTIFKDSQPATTAFIPKRVISLYADKNLPEIFYSSGEQLIRLKLNTSGKIDTILTYEADELQTHSLNSNFISTIRKENDSTLWLGTLGGGVNKMILQKNGKYHATSLNFNNKFENIETLEIDDNNNIWAGGNNLFKYNTQTKELQEYKIPGGLNSYKIGSSYKATDGTIYMGGIDGLVYFNPNKISNNTTHATPNISQIEINNKKRLFGEEIKLNYFENHIKIFLTATHYNSPRDCKFKYRLVGYQDDWRQVPLGSRTLFYSNLPYKKYTLEVMATNNDGVWSPTIYSIPIIVSPPWWLTTTAKLVYTLLCLVAFILIYIYTKHWLQLRRELHLKQFVESQTNYIQNLRQQFFTNISHELRTPLTLIKATVEKLAKDQQWTKESENILNRNIIRMSHLIDNVIKIDQIKDDIPDLQIQQTQTIPFFSSLCSNFQNLAEIKNIKFSVNITDYNLQDNIWVDQECVTNMLFNLLSNAFKYTPNNKKIEVIISKSNKKIEHKHPTINQIIQQTKSIEHSIYIQIIDTGIGIRKESLLSICDRYYKVENDNYKTPMSSGLGLSLVKKLVKNHKGNLSLSSEYGQGTDFIIQLPCAESEYSEQNILPTIEQQSKDCIKEDYKITKESISNTSNLLKPTIIIIEDNFEIRLLLKQSLYKKYQIIEAENGLEALDIIKKEKVDLIISDLMMPKMDGLELCRTLKDNSSYTNIPFILLTAKTSIESKIEGLNYGADAYLEKPISLALLNSTIDNLLDSKKKMKNYLSTNYLSITVEDRLQEEDKDFYQELTTVIERNISDPDLDVNFLCKEMGYSRTRLYQKANDVIGMPIKQYVRTLRLKAAIKIMAEEDIAIADILLRIGIKSQSYFTTIFKKEFRKTPSDFMKDLKHE
ncbi:MAG: response regulator [Bacteroides sp.]|nr:response regulator [Bacteroides sp.]MDD4719409.1 response regulator [Bacteroides sp.]